MVTAARGTNCSLRGVKPSALWLALAVWTVLMSAFVETAAQEQRPGWKGYAPKYEKSAADAQHLVSTLPEAVIVKDNTLVGFRTPHWQDLNTPPEEVQQALVSYRVVSGGQWLHDYNHVSGGDESGWIVHPTQERLQWMLRPGGLAAVLYPDGGVLYLVACRIHRDDC